jgi:hypothetical protein
MWGKGIKKRETPTFTSVSLYDMLAARSLACNARFRHLGRPPFLLSQSSEGFTDRFTFFRWKKERRTRSSSCKATIGQDKKDTTSYGKSTGRKFLVYNNIFGGPRRRGHVIKNEEFFLHKPKNRPASQFLKHPACFSFGNGPQKINK